MELCRYIVLNPIRAGMVDDPVEWPWSSYRATRGIAKVPECLTTNWILGNFSNEPALARKRYEDFVKDGIQLGTPWREVEGQTILGTKDFVEKIKGLLQTKESVKEIPREQRFAGRPLLQAIFKDVPKKDKNRRNKGIHQAHLKYGYTLKEIGDFLGYHYTTISKVIKINKEENS